MVELSVGGHSRPEEGRCLMEHVSDFLGETFRPWNRHTHPALAALAVRVNDSVSEVARADLARRVPALAAGSSGDPGFAWMLVERCAEAHLALEPDDRGARRRRSRARARRRMWSRLLPARVLGRLPAAAPVACSLAGLDELLVAFAALRRISGPPGSAERDRVLVGVLDEVLASMPIRRTSPAKAVP